MSIMRELHSFYRDDVVNFLLPTEYLGLSKRRKKGKNEFPPGVYFVGDKGYFATQTLLLRIGDIEYPIPEGREIYVEDLKEVSFEDVEENFEDVEDDDEVVYCKYGFVKPISYQFSRFPYKELAAFNSKYYSLFSPTLPNAELFDGIVGDKTMYNEVHFLLSPLRKREEWSLRKMFMKVPRDVQTTFQARISYHRQQIRFELIKFYKGRKYSEESEIIDDYEVFATVEIPARKVRKDEPWSVTVSGSDFRYFITRDVFSYFALAKIRVWNDKMVFTSGDDRKVAAAFGVLRGE